MTGLKILPPVLGVEDSLDVNDTVRPARLLYLGKGHTDGDLVLYLPKEKIAFVGDLFFNSALPNTQDAFLLEWMRTLAELLKLEAETFVPGHGPVSEWPAALIDERRYLMALLTDVRAANKKGEPIRTAADKAAASERPHWELFDDYNARNATAAFSEIEWE